MRAVLTFACVLALPGVLGNATSALAQPVPHSPFRQGANHHLGDSSYIAAYGHAPGPRDREPDRMHAHLAFVHDWLARRAATDPKLAARRAEILGYLAEYVAHGKTPANEHVPWRTPVFIDDHGTICAVGYLIERTTGRALPEKIAAAHRYDYIEDIAHDMPEVADWVASSGFTLDEIASIQPAYEAPNFDAWLVWDLAKHRPADGPYDKHGWKGEFRRGQMEGAWTVSDGEGHILGRGTLHHGAGTWTSFYPSGDKLAEGPFAKSRAHGHWQIFYPSGRIAADGNFDAGRRDGKWSFFQDTEEHPPLARGHFADNWVTGTWQHFDGDGHLAAISKIETPDQWTAVDPYIGTDGGEGSLLEELGPLHHAIHQGTVGGFAQRLETFEQDGERIYIHDAFEHETIYDANGFALVHGDAGWQASDCHWANRRRVIARAGDLVRLHGLLYQEARRRVGSSGHDMSGEQVENDAGPTCGAARPVAAARARILDAMLAARDQVRAIPPSAVRAVILDEEAADSGDEAAEPPRDYTSLLADDMRMYVEWPHIDGKFIELFGTMPGRFDVPWYDRNQDSNAP